MTTSAFILGAPDATSEVPFPLWETEGRQATECLFEL